MKKASKGNTGVDIPLFPAMIVHGLIFQGEGSTVLVESYHTPTCAQSTSPPHLSSPSKSFIIQETEVPQPSSPIHTHVADEAASTDPSMPHDSPLLKFNTLRSDEGSITLQELTVLCTTLSQKVESLEADLTQTKKVYGVANTKLIIKVKRLEMTVKTGKARRKTHIVVSEDEEEFEDPSKQGRSMIEEINQDAEVTLVTSTQVNTQGEAHSQDQPENRLGVLIAAKVLADTARKNIQTYSRRRTVSTGSGRVSTASRMISTTKESVSTVGALMAVSTAGEELDQGRSKKQKIDESSEPRNKDVDKL
nr:hypothetical protein [Tanacetum cinerariifolium]